LVRKVVNELFNWSGWLESMMSGTRRQYQLYVERYLDWLRGEKLFDGAEGLLRDYDVRRGREQAAHVDLLKRWLQVLGSSRMRREIAYYAVRNFYEFHHLTLPKFSRAERRAMFRVSEGDIQRKMEDKVITREELRSMLLECSQPYRSILLLMFQTGMGQAEFQYFNTHGWRGLTEQLREKEPVKVDLYRQKVSTEEVHKYFTFIGQDGKEAIIRWLPQRTRILKTAKGRVSPKAQSALFIVYSRKENQITAPNRHSIWKAMQTAAIKIGFREPKGYNRFKPHNLRDAFRSFCQISGVKDAAAELFLGHEIDSLQYDKSPELAPNHFRDEYLKVEPQLNIFSNPGDEQRIHQQQENIRLLEEKVADMNPLQERIAALELDLAQQRGFIEYIREQRLKQLKKGMKK